MKVRCMGCMEEYDSYFDVCPQCGMRQNVTPDGSAGLKPETIIKQRYMVGLPLDTDDIGMTYIGYDLIDLKRVIVNEYEKIPGHILSFRRIDVPGMVPVLDVFVERKRQYVITEYVSGETLEELLLSEEQMSLDETLSYMFPVMEILAQLHEKGLHHLKVNPNNIFLLDSGEIHLMAPGVYQSVVGHHRKKNAPADEVFYMAPELKDGSGQGGAAADVYSVCAILYRMITGEIAIKGADRKNAEVLINSEKKAAADTRNNSIINGLLSEADVRTQVMAGLIEQFTSIWDVERANLPDQSGSASPLQEGSGSKHSITYENVGKKGFGKAPLIMGLVVIVAAVGAFGFMKMRSKAPATVASKTEQMADDQVPNLIKSSKENAEKLLEDNGMKLLVDDTCINEEAEKGIILKQKPMLGEKIPENKEISVVLSAESVTLMEKKIYERRPDSFDAEKNVAQNGDISTTVEGYDKQDSLEKDGFKIHKEQKESNIIPGYVISIEGTEENQVAEVKADTELPDGCALTVTTSKGVEGLDSTQNIKLPELTGKSFDKALKLAQKEGFYIGLSDETENSMERPGLISKMTLLNTTKDGQAAADGKEVKSGATVMQGANILLTLSEGPKQISSTSSLLGDDAGDVNAMLEDKDGEYRLNVERTDAYNDNYGNYPAGTVMKIEKVSCKHTDWGLDGDLHWGDTVRIIVSDGSRPTTEAPAPTRPATGGSSGGSSGSGSSGNSGNNSSNSSGGGSSNSNRKEKTVNDNKIKNDAQQE